MPAAAQTKLKFAHVYETSEAFHAEALWAAAEIAKRTNNKYQIDVFPASALGNEQQISQALPLGTIDMAYLGASFVGAIYKPISIVNAPYIWRDIAHHTAFSKSPLLTELTDGYFKQTGHKIVAITYYGARHTTANKALNTPGGHEKHEAAGAAGPDVHDVRQGGRRQPHPHRLRRGLSGPAERNRGRAGESAADHPGQEVLRGAVPHQPDRSHPGQPDDDDLLRSLEQADPARARDLRLCLQAGGRTGRRQHPRLRGEAGGLVQAAGQEGGDPGPQGLPRGGGEDPQRRLRRAPSGPRSCTTACRP